MMDREKLTPLFKDGHYYSVPRGVSMWPLIKTPNCVVHIVPVDRELKRYDVALYHRKSTDQYAIGWIRQYAARYGFTSEEIDRYWAVYSLIEDEDYDRYK